MDTARDYRILVALDAVERLGRRVRQWGLPWPLNRSRAAALVDEARRLLLRIRYSYLPADMLASSPELRRLLEVALELRGLLLPRQQTPRLKVQKALAVAEMRYSLAILAGLRRRILLGDENRPEYAVDVIGAEVVRVQRLEGSRNLFVTRMAAGRLGLTVVTNISSLRVGEVRAVAILPPQEFLGVVSEAMISSGPIDKGFVGKRVPPQLLSDELRSQVISIALRV